MPAREWAMANSSIWYCDLVHCLQLPMMLSCSAIFPCITSPADSAADKELNQLEVPVCFHISKSAPDDSLDTESKQEAYRFDPLSV